MQEARMEPEGQMEEGGTMSEGATGEGLEEEVSGGNSDGDKESSESEMIEDVEQTDEDVDAELIVHILRERLGQDEPNGATRLSACGHWKHEELIKAYCELRGMTK